ncbi:MAG: IS1595 family transposase [Acidobacteria bacterium]|nr:MAG: IS1595 family transposase [Acidobacteriota bacterium]
MLCWRVMEGVRTMARPDFPRSLAEFQSRFVTEDDCRRYLVECRWPDDYRCPRCAHAEAYELSTRELFQCRSCRHQVSVTAGTILHRTRVPLHLWFSAAYLVTTHTPGFSAVQLQRQLGLNRYETAWTMVQKLRRAMIRPERDRISEADRKLN